MKVSKEIITTFGCTCNDVSRIMNVKLEQVRVAFLHPRLEGGGAERVSLSTARQFSAWGIKSVFIATAHNPKEFILPEELHGGVTIQLLPDPFLGHPANKDALVSLVREESIDVLFTCYIGLDFLQAIKPDLTCKLVFWNHAKPFWELDYRDEEIELQCRYSIKKWFKWNILGGRFRHNKEQIKQNLYRDYISCLQICDRYIVLCPEYGEEIKQALDLSQEKAQKITSIYNTITPPYLEECPIRKKQIVYVGRLSLVQKRFDRLLEVWARVQHALPDWDLLFWGAGPDEWVFHKKVKSLGLSRVYLKGYATNLDDIYREASILAMTSSFEGVPMVVLEGQSYGLVPIAYDTCAGLARFVREGGVLVEPYDIEEFSRQLILLAKDEEYRAKLSKDAMASARLYTPQVNEQLWLNFFASLDLVAVE